MSSLDFLVLKEIQAILEYNACYYDLHYYIYTHNYCVWLRKTKDKEL